LPKKISESNPALLSKSDKKPSKKLQAKIRAIPTAFKKLEDSVYEALELGKEEGFTEKEIGQMIREEMVKAGYSIRTVQRYLPAEAKAKPRGISDKVSLIESDQTESEQQKQQDDENWEDPHVAELKKQRKLEEEEKDRSVANHRTVQKQEQQLEQQQTDSQRLAAKFEQQIQQPEQQQVQQPEQQPEQQQEEQSQQQAQQQQQEEQLDIPRPSPRNSETLVADPRVLYSGSSLAKDVHIKHEPELKSGFLELSRKGLKITNYSESSP
jgi:hypothetical protein